MSDLLPAVPKVGAKVATRDIEAIERHVAENVSRLNSVEEAREWQDQARALEAYLRGKDLCAPMLGAQRRVEARIGELLGAPRPGPKQSSVVTEVSKDDRSDFRTLAHGFNGCKLTEDEWRQSRRALVSLIRDRIGECVDAGPLPTGTFHTLTADPPWQYGNKATRGAAEDHYSTLSIDQLCGRESLPDGRNLVKEVDERMAPESHLYLWVTNGFLREGFDVVEAWGFAYKTCLTWVKPQMGMGNYFRGSTEHILFGVRGSLRTNERNIVNWFQAPRSKHSAKPGCFYDLVEKASPGPYLEMFARSARLGDWKYWGDESIESAEIAA